MKLEPTDRARQRCAHFLSRLMDSPPDGFQGLVVERTKKGGAEHVDFIDADDLDDDDAESLFLEHVEQYQAVGGGLRYRVRCLDATGKVVPNGATCSWGLRRTATDDAGGARRAGGGAEYAATAIGRAQGETLAQMMKMLQELTPQAAGHSADTMQLLLEIQNDRHRDNTEMMGEMMRLQTALVRANADLERPSGIFEGETGAQLLLALVSAVAPVVQSGAAWLAELVKSAQLRNTREAQELGIAAAIESAQSATSSSPEGDAPEAPAQT